MKRSTGGWPALRPPECEFYGSQTCCFLNNQSDLTRSGLAGRRTGGYVCLDDFTAITRALSLGIEENVEWDLELARKGIIVHQFDHTVEAPPISHENFRYERKKVVPVSGLDDTEASLSSILGRHKEDADEQVILKIDIEHDEWPVFEAAPLRVLTQFSQILAEFHGFNLVLDDTWYDRALSVLTKLQGAFEVIHVHGNNNRPWSIIGNVLFPQVLEVTYVNRERYSFQSSEAIFPTSLDARNSPRMPDMFLGRFQFSEKPNGGRRGSLPR